MKKILIIEDDTCQSKLYKRILEKEPYEVTIASTADEAAELLNENKYDLHIVDMMLKGSAISGVDIVKSEIDNILIVSALHIDKDSFKSIDVLRKPFRNDELLKIVKTYLQ